MVSRCGRVSGRVKRNAILKKKTMHTEVICHVPMCTNNFSKFSNRKKANLLHNSSKFKLNSYNTLIN